MGKWTGETDAQGKLKLEPRSTPPTDTMYCMHMCCCVHMLASFSPRWSSIIRCNLTRSLLLPSHLKTGEAATVLTAREKMTGKLR